VAAQKDTVKALLDRHGQTFAEELGIDVEKNTPSPLFRLLCAAVLMSARISTQLSTEAARSLAGHGWRTPEKLAGSTWEQRVRALNEAGYTRYQERTATMLGDLTEHLLVEYDGDLRRLRAAAGREPEAERKRLKAFKGLGDVGVDIFLREVQVAWDELRPFADRRALDAAGRLNLPRDPKKLAGLAGGPDRFARLVAALVRVGLEDDFGEVRKAARGRAG
jgi:endonuclease III